MDDSLLAGARLRTLTRAPSPGGRDSFGRLTAVVNGADRLDYHFSGAVMDYATSSTAGNLVRTDYTYNGPGGALSQETTKLNGTALSSIGYNVGSTGHLNSITYPSGRTVGYTWSQGRVSGVTVNGATLAGLGYDGWGNLNNVTYASGAKTDWAYNATGAALGSWKVTPVGEPVETRDYSYDANMNLNGITPDWVSLTHDAKGQLTHAQGYNLNLGFAHDVFGNNTSATVATPPGPDWLNPFTAVNPWTDNRVPSTASGKWTGWVTNGRGEALNLGSKLDSMVSIQPSWDGLGRLSGITKPGANQGYLYAPSGMRVWVTDTSDNSRSRKYGYTSGGMLLSEAAPATAGRLSAQSLRVLHATSGAGAVSRNLGGFAAGDTVTVSVWFRAAAGVSGALAIHDGKAGDPSDSKRFVSLVGTGGWQQLQITLTLARADNLWVHLYGDMYTTTSSSATASTFVDYDDLLVKKNGNTLLQDGFESGLNLGTDPWSPTQWYACAAGLASLRTTSGLPDQWKRDVIYAGGRAIAEIDDKGIHELHTDHLGSPRVITAGSSGMTVAGTGAPVALGHVEAKQAFAPYGELITDPQWTTGYAPLTGYTGHVQQDPTGLIYMRGRYYSPAWHRFLNSDQGVDPMQFNQFAYVGGSPLQATDPSGLIQIQPGTKGWTKDGQCMICTSPTGCDTASPDGWVPCNTPGATVEVTGSSEPFDGVGADNDGRDWGPDPKIPSLPPAIPPPPPSEKDPCINGLKPLVLKNAATKIGMPACGSGTCVDLLKSTMGNYPTATWVKGAAPTTSTPIGTFVATFYANNRTKYQSESGLGHVGAFNGFSTNGILLVDQYRNAPNHQIQNSNIRWGGTRNYNANANNYYVVMIPCK